MGWLFLALWMAHAGEIRPDQQALLLLKVVSYDRERSRAPGEPSFRIGVVYDEGHPASVRAAERMMEAITHLGAKVRLDGAEVEAVLLPAAELEEGLERDQPDVLYVAASSEGPLGRILATARAYRLTTFTGSDELYERGVGVGLLARGGRARLAIDLARVREEGADFSSSLLKVADVRRRR